jgi:hypothetical protein
MAPASDRDDKQPERHPDRQHQPERHRPGQQHADGPVHAEPRHPKRSAGEHTFAEDGGPGFVHVGFSGRCATLACSTELSLKSCFATLMRRAQRYRGLVKAMTDTKAHWLAQQDHPQALIERSMHIYAIPGSFEKLLDFPSNVVALRLDVGSLSWQWDDISSPAWPKRRSFGGLADISSIVSVGGILRDVADAWPRDNHDVFDHAYEFLRDHVE